MSGQEWGMETSFRLRIMDYFINKHIYLLIAMHAAHPQHHTHHTHCNVRSTPGSMHACQLVQRAFFLMGHTSHKNGTCFVRITA
jgi:hypothetical protein